MRDKFLGGFLNTVLYDPIRRRTFVSPTLGEYLDKLIFCFSFVRMNATRQTPQTKFPDRSDGTKPSRLTDAGRISEVAEILAVGLMRVLAHKSRENPADKRESSLDFSATKSGHRRSKSGEACDG